MVERARVSVITAFKARSEQDIDWLIEAVKSVQEQTYTDWEIVMCNDHSTVRLDRLQAFLKTLPKGKVFGRTAQTTGVSGARNTAVKAAHGELILPLDADDLLMPNTLEVMINAWDAEGHERGIVYGDVEMFGQDWSKVFKAEPYDFNELLRRVYILVGSLYRKSDWEKVGGWKKEMDEGLEDWEYWISLGEIGVCGYYVPQTLYRYRKHTQGRLSWLKQDQERFSTSMQRLRDLHKDVYKGRFPMACCGKSKSAPVTFTRSASPAAAFSATLPDSRVEVLYTGGRTGSFFVTGKATGTKYKVMGPNKPLITTDSAVGVLKADVEFILQLGGGKDFRVVG